MAQNTPHHKPLIWIGYTTRYRDGGDRLEQVAYSMAADLARERTDASVCCAAVETKRAFVEAMETTARRGQRITELHFVGHSGMYGPMFGTTDLPEQFSPHEWRTLANDGVIPFAEDGEAFFHACRTARWFAPFFARTFGLPAHGFHWYTAFSRRPDTFAFAPPGYPASWPLYLLGCRGKKSHGLLGSTGKHLGLLGHEPIKRFAPEDLDDADASYDPVAHLYDEVFTDITVRRDEWRWIHQHVAALDAAPPKLLDIGCGNGAMLRELHARLPQGLGQSVGVDQSAKMIDLASAHAREVDALSFRTIDGPILPFEDDGFDAVTSLLSFRYLDWDPIMREILRVLKPQGHLLVVDMVTAPMSLDEIGLFVRSKLDQLTRQTQNDSYRAALRRLVSDPRWETMLRYNPIRAEHELTWYLESRFPGHTVELLNVGWHNRVLAFDSGPITSDHVLPQSYP